MLSVRNLSFSHNANVVFDDVSFSVDAGQKVGLIGPNGAGKSTLLKILNQEEIPHQGKLEILGSIGMVPQEVKHDPIMAESSTIREYLDPSHLRLEYELQKMMIRMELYELVLESSPRNLSGGQKTRLALARALLAQPDILMLDEPTNFLDMDGKKWVMDFLAKYPKTLILISHDVELMDKYIDKILFINSQSKKIEEYKGNLSQALSRREEQQTLFKKQVRLEKRNIERLEETAKILGARDRVILQRRVARLKQALPELPLEVRQIKFKLPEPDVVGSLPLKATNIFKSFGDKKVLENINISIERGEKVALIGPNGVGKSTFIKILMGLLEPDSGKVFRDQNLKVGYYSQEFETMGFDKTILETAREKSRDISDGVIRPVLASFLFPASRVNQHVGTLSGGEKTRLSIALLLLQNYNLLILDEPTTYLDTMSQRIILQVLKEFRGAMLIVSHTEEFIKELQPSRALILPENYFDVWSEDFLEKVSQI